MVWRLSTLRVVAERIWDACWRFRVWKGEVLVLGRRLLLMPFCFCQQDWLFCLMFDVDGVYMGSGMGIST